MRGELLLHFNFTQQKYYRVATVTFCSGVGPSKNKVQLNYSDKRTQIHCLEIRTTTIRGYNHHMPVERKQAAIIITEVKIP